ncbi:hypothetical protein WN944_028137 [Citrus x changshan-huyou]|uniref:Uncharacterized protein n=1 Tax=Citrus x changshan-huyou TaxID=2935761 RepID=A0AAP0LN74_9ROSI
MGVTWKVLRTLATFETQAAKMIKIMNGWDNVRQLSTVQKFYSLEIDLGRKLNFPTISISGAPLYAVNKGAMNQLPKKLTCEWAGDSIRANSVAHWFVKTSLNEAYFADEKFSEAVTSRTPKNLPL